MSNVANAEDLYNDKGTGANYESSFTFKSGVNENVYVKEWALESNENGTNLKIVFYQAVEGKAKDECSTMTQYFYFPSGTISAKRLKVFIQSIGSFVEQFVSVEQAAERYKAVLSKYNITGFDLDDDAVRNDQIKKLIRGWFDLIQPKINTKGTLICGYQTPREVNGEIKQYLSVPKYGQNNFWEPAFRTNGKTTVPTERTSSFKDEQDKKYNFWSYTRAESTSVENPHNEIPPTTTSVDAQEEW